VSAVPVVIKPLRNIVGVGTAGSGLGPTVGNTIKSVSTNSTTTIVADAVVEELHDDEMAITEHPVEVGSVIADHAYNLPAALSLTYAWSAGSSQNKGSSGDPLAFLKKLYQQLLGLKTSATFCSVNTGKRVYQNMLIKRISTRSDKDNENSMTVNIVLQEILLATTQVIPLAPAAAQAIPQKTSPTVNQGATQLQPAPNFNSAATP
jgi:hypothetical protein